MLNFNKLEICLSLSSFAGAYLIYKIIAVYLKRIKYSKIPGPPVKR
jgi:hypothetical protein